MAAAQSKAVGGLQIYLGVVTAELTKSHPGEHEESKMHRLEEQPLSHLRHVMVAVFDRESGKRIVDADVRATVEHPGMSAVGLPLRPMTVNDQLTYGNFFAMPFEGAYVITVSVKRPGAPTAVAARFEYVLR